MKRTIVLSLALIIGIITANAQNETSKKTYVKPRQTELEILQNQVDDAEKTFQDYFGTDRALKSLKEPVINNVKKRHESVKTALEKIIDKQQEKLKACQDTLAAFRFFSNTGETIFADSTLERNGWSKKLTGVYLAQYNTISSIRDAAIAISEVENTIIKKTSQKQEMGWNDEKLKAAIVLEIEKAMTVTIAKQLDDIDKMDLSFLSSKQKEYYKNLSIRFDKIFNTYF